MKIYVKLHVNLNFSNETDILQTWIDISIEAPSDENNGLPKEPNKICGDFKKYDNDKEMNESNNYYQ